MTLTTSQAAPNSGCSPAPSVVVCQMLSSAQKRYSKSSPSSPSFHS